MSWPPGSAIRPNLRAGEVLENLRAVETLRQPRNR